MRYIKLYDAFEFGDGVLFRAQYKGDPGCENFTKNDISFIEKLHREIELNSDLKVVKDAKGDVRHCKLKVTRPGDEWKTLLFFEITKIEDEYFYVTLVKTLYQLHAYGWEVADEATYYYECDSTDGIKQLIDFTINGKIDI